MKCLVYLLTLLLLPLSAFNQELPPRIGLEKEAFYNSLKMRSAHGVHKKNYWYYKVDHGIVTRDKFKELQIEYFKDGRVKEKIYLTPTGKQTAIVLHDYDEEGKLLKESEFTPMGKQIGRVRYRYSPEGYLREITEYDAYGYIISKTVYLLDSTALSLTELVYSSPDSIKSKNVAYYSDFDTGSMIEYHEYTTEHAIEYKKKLEWEEGRLKREEYQHPDGRFAYYLDFSYDPRGNLIEVKRLVQGNSEFKKMEYNYTPEGLLAGEIEYNQQGRIVSYYKYIFEK